MSLFWHIFESLHSANMRAVVMVCPESIDATTTIKVSERYPQLAGRQQLKR